MTAVSKAIADVLSERVRQIEVEGWTPELDDKHNCCEMAAAAACYAVAANTQHLRELKVYGVQLWPWHLGWWKPTTYRRNLVKAAALLLAEIERLDRKETLL